MRSDASGVSDRILMPPPPKIAHLSLESPFLLAPMAGFTDYAFRRICRRLGAGMVFTEMASVEGLRRRSPKTLHYLEAGREEKPVAAHLYGADPAAFAEAAEVAESLGRFDLIDINCGCPVPKITRRGAGTALIREPEKIAAIVKTVRAAGSLPVTVKTRPGIVPGHPRIREVLRAAEAGGAAALIIHGRWARDRHGGEADWKIIGEIGEEAAIPVIGNGGIESAGDALDKLRRYRVDGVMIGRAAIGNPWIFSEAKALLEGEPFIPPTPAERFRVISEHLETFSRSKLMEARIRGRDPNGAGNAACREFYGHLVGYLAGIPGLGALKRKIAHLPDPETLLLAAAELLEL